MNRRFSGTRLLLIYLARINELADRPEFYHLLSNSCTINIVRCANAAHGPRISTASSPVSAWVIATNEELMIARHCRTLVA